MGIGTKILGVLAMVASFAALFFRGQMFKSREARVKDREKVKDKAHDIQRKSTKARHKGDKKLRDNQAQPIDYDKPDDKF